MRKTRAIDFADAPGLIDRVEGVGLDAPHHLHHIVLVPSRADHVKHGDGAGKPLTLKGGHCMSGLPNFFGEFFAALCADDPQDDVSKSNPLFENDADHVACGKTQRIENTEDGLFPDAMDDGGYDDQPHADLQESEQEGNPCSALHNADGPHGSHRDIRDSCQEND